MRENKCKTSVGSVEKLRHDRLENERGQVVRGAEAVVAQLYEQAFTALVQGEAAIARRWLWSAALNIHVHS